VDDPLQLPRCGVVDPFLATLRANCRFHFTHHDYSAADVGAERGFAFGLFAAAERANLIGIAHSFFLVRFTTYVAEYQLSLFPTRRTLPLRIRSSVRVPLTPLHASQATRSRWGQLRDFAKASPCFAASLQRSFRSAGELEPWLKLYHTSF